ncbi:MAG: hypothetical protein A2Z73_03270 [Deltaproteobacteria bacterium RBG_13_60_28]|nr:MAG: hypothetical protein A2Z73_03270 [Deltaproteobacteria bacterium RBG_13_60_28]
MMGRLFKRGLLGLVIAGLAFWTMMPAAALPGELVNFKQLLPFVDLKLPGWEMEDKPSGTTMKHQHIQMSEAKTSYRAGDKTLNIVILDFLGQTMPWLAMLPQMEMESSEEYLRTTTVGDFKALENYKFKDKHGELNISVADRFWVKVEGGGIDNTEPLKAAAQQMDLKKLATLAK